MRWLCLCGLVLAWALAGCNSILGIEEGTLRDDGGAVRDDDAGSLKPVDGSVGAEGGRTSDVHLPDALLDSDIAAKPDRSPCSIDGECASTHCVDGYCCNDACTGQCEACDVATLEGTCAPVTGPPHTVRTPCGGTAPCDGQCGGTVRTSCTFPGVATSCRMQSCSGSMKSKAAGCDGLGACLAVEMVSCIQGCLADDCLGACKTDAECLNASPTTPYCDAGGCTAKKPRGRTCTSGTECTSTFCADGYCCNSDCNFQCGSCKETTSLGTCIHVTGGPRTGGTPARVGCGGTGQCLGQCDGVANSCILPGGSTLCGTAVCQGGMLTPVGSCSGGTCMQAQMACGTNYCISGSACGNCPNDAACSGGKYCAAGTCTDKKGNNVTCSAGNECLQGNCETGSTGSGNVCCDSDCTGTAPRCQSDGTGCVCGGTSCGGGKECCNGGCCTTSQQVCHAATGACCTPSCSGCRISAGGSDGCGGTCPANCNTANIGEKCCSPTCCDLVCAGC